MRDNVGKKQLKNFVNADSWKFFSILGIDSTFLDDASWSSRSEYAKASGFLKHLRVTNEAAERGVKLVSDFLGLAKTEGVLQDYLQVVEKNRQDMPNMRTPKRARR